MPISINPINVNAVKPSFKGVVKVDKVFVGDERTFDDTVIDSATRQLKAVIIRKDKDGEVLWEKLEENCGNKEKTISELEENLKDRLGKKGLFRQIYRFFDKDYVIPMERIKDDGRDIFTKVRIKEFKKLPSGKYEVIKNDVYMASGLDAKNLADDGTDIGNKGALERYDERNAGLLQMAKNEYHSQKKEIENKYKESSSKPTINLYTVRDKRGIIRLVGAKMGNTKMPMHAGTPYNQTVIFNPQYLIQTPKTEAATPPVTTATPIKDTKPVQMQGLADGIPHEDKGKNPTLEELATKSWDSVELKAKKAKAKSKRKKVKDAPGQMTFNI